MPQWAEWAARSHNELIEVLSAAGIAAGLAMLALMAYLLWPRREGNRHTQPTPDSPHTVPLWLAAYFPSLPCTARYWEPWSAIT